MSSQLDKFQPVDSTIDVCAWGVAHCRAKLSNYGHSPSHATSNRGAHRVLFSPFSDVGMLFDALLLHEVDGTGTALGDLIDGKSCRSLLMIGSSHSVKARHGDVAAAKTRLVTYVNNYGPRAQVQLCIGGTIIHGTHCVLLIHAVTLPPENLSVFGFRASFGHALLETQPSMTARVNGEFDPRSFYVVQFRALAPFLPCLLVVLPWSVYMWALDGNLAKTDAPLYMSRNVILRVRGGGISKCGVDQADQADEVVLADDLGVMVAELHKINLQAYTDRAQLCLAALGMERAVVEAHLTDHAGMKKGHVRKFMTLVWSKVLDGNHPLAMAASRRNSSDASTKARVAASESAQRALDDALVGGNMSEHAEVAIIGGGLAGLLLASTFVGEGASPIVLERNTTAGGFWRQHGSAFSSVQSSEPSYRLHVQARKRPNTNHSSYSEIIADVLRTIEKHNLAPRIHTHTEVSRVAEAAQGGGWLLVGLHHTRVFSILCAFVVLTTNRHLGLPRYMQLPGEDAFNGTVRRGLGGDVNPLRCAGSRVIVLGMGAFAIENMCTSLERGAAHVTILCRRRRTVCPQVVEWVNFIRPYDQEFKRSTVGNAVVLSHWQKAYDISYATQPESWKVEGVLNPDGQMISTSDMFFIAHHLRMLATLLGEVSRLDAVSLVTQGENEKRLTANVVIKCIGFEPYEGNERLLGRTFMRSVGMVERGLWLPFESHLDTHSFNSPFGSFNAVLIARYWKKAGLASQLSHGKMSRINSVAVSETLKRIDELARVDPEVPSLLHAHLASMAAAFHASMSPAVYTAANLRHWEDTYDMLLRVSPDGVARLAYPFAILWEELPDISADMWEPTVVGPTTAQQPSGAPARPNVVSLKEVLCAVKQVVAGTVDADTPLMDAGLDSLSSTELRSLLQSAAGAELPATLIFEAPTARLIAGVLNCDTTAADVVKFSRVTEGTEGAYLDECALRLPKGSEGLREAWRVAVSACNLVGEVPATRWVSSDAAIAAACLTVEQKGCVRHGGYAVNVQRFDNRIFAITALESTATDPQQRLLMEHGYEALHVANQRRDTLLGSNAGIFLGMEYFDFSQIVFDGPKPQSVFALNSGAMAAGRTSFVLGLQGPCALIGTTCSSGLVAARGASDALTANECELALATAASLILRPTAHVWHSRSGGLSPRGRCHSFDSRADGFARSEAVVAAVLRVNGARALASQVVRSDGRSASFTAPNGRAQQQMLVAALASAGVAVEQVTCYEGHATGTALGDPTEVGSVAAALLRPRSVAASLVLGSVKGNVAHVEPGAGLAGLLLLACALEAVSATPNAQLRAMNEHVNAALLGLASGAVSQATRLPDSKVRTGGVSAFGINGTIAHAMIRLRTALKYSDVGAVPLMYSCRAFSWQATKSASRDLPSQPTLAMPIDADTPLMQAGIRSQQAVSLADRLNKLSGVALSATLIFEHPTPRAIAAHLATASEAGGELCGGDALVALVNEFVHSSSPHGAQPQINMEAAVNMTSLLPLLDKDAFGDRVAKLRAGLSDQAPFFALHTPDGLCSVYLGIASVLRNPHPIFGIEHGSIRTGDPVYTCDVRLEELASEYGHLVLGVCDACAYTSLHIIGASFGAALAHSAARVVELAGNRLRTLVLIDPPAPGMKVQKARYGLFTRLEWRRVAATTLLTRSSIMAMQPITEEYARDLFALPQADEIDLIFAQHLAELGMASSSMSTVVESRRRLDAWVHSNMAMITSCWGDNLGTNTAVNTTTRVLLVLSTERDTFFGEGPSVSALASYFATSPIEIRGGHLFVLATCTAGKEPRFNLALDDLLAEVQA